MKQHCWFIPSMSVLPSQLEQANEKCNETLDTCLSWTREGRHRPWCSNTLRFSNSVWFTLTFTVVELSLFWKVELILEHCNVIQHCEKTIFQESSESFSKTGNHFMTQNTASFFFIPTSLFSSLCPTPLLYLLWKDTTQNLFVIWKFYETESQIRHILS